MKHFFLFFLLYSSFIEAQVVQLEFNQLANQQLEVFAFDGIEVIKLQQHKFDQAGKLQFQLASKIEGMGYLSVASKEQNLILAFTDEEIHLTGIDFSDYSSIQVKKGEENQSFFSYSEAYPKRMQVLSAWTFLQERYDQEKLLGNNKKISQQIEKEMDRLLALDEDFINNLPDTSYVKWFIPKRKLVSNVAMVVQQQPHLIPQTISAFRDLDYTDDRLFKSGLFREAIENHFWLIENGVGDLKEVFKQMKISIDALQENLQQDELKLNMAFSFLFDLLEKRSLFEASEYLAVNVLEQNECEVDGSLAKRLETYRKMKKGNQVADILFHNVETKESIIPKRLSEIQSDYVLVVFGSSWCPACTEEIPEINQHYKKWKAKGVEVVLVSLDTNEQAYRNFVQGFEFVSTCDFKKWKTQAVEDYHVNATPSMFLLDKERTLLVKPKSVAHAEVWISQYVK